MEIKNTGIKSLICAPGNHFMYFINALESDCKHYSGLNRWDILFNNILSWWCFISWGTVFVLLSSRSKNVYKTQNLISSCACFMHHQNPIDEYAILCFLREDIPPSHYIQLPSLENMCDCIFQTQWTFLLNDHHHGVWDPDQVLTSVRLTDPCCVCTIIHFFTNTCNVELCLLLLLQLSWLCSPCVPAMFCDLYMMSLSLHREYCVMIVMLCLFRQNNVVELEACNPSDL